MTIKATFVDSASRPNCEQAKNSKRISVRTNFRHPSAVASYPNYPPPVPSSYPALGKLVVVVTDTGAGISKENQKRLFNEIVQFNPEKLQAGGGSGLGLWITQEILNLHDGSISVSSEGEGKGSSFTVKIPMIREPQAILTPLLEIEQEHCIPECRPDPVPQQVEQLRTAPESDPVCSTQIVLPFDLLVVDDSRLNRKMLLKCLRADGHTCVEAEDGLEAIEMVKERIDHVHGGNGRPFDAILMDFIMPNMDGPTATREIRALGYTAPLFGVTGNGECP